MKDRLHRLTPRIFRLIIVSLVAITAARLGLAFEIIAEPVGIAILIAAGLLLMFCLVYVLPQSTAVYFGAIALSAVPITLAIFAAIGTVDQFPTLREEMNDGTPRGLIAVVAVTLLLLIVGCAAFFLALRWLNRRLH